MGSKVKIGKIYGEFKRCLRDESLAEDFIIYCLKEVNGQGAIPLDETNYAL